MRNDPLKVGRLSNHLAKRNAKIKMHTGVIVSLVIRSSRCKNALCKQNVQIPR